MRKLDIRIVLADFRDDITPQLGRFQHICLVHRAQPTLAPTGGLEAALRDATDLGLAVAHGVEAFALAGLVGADAPRLPEVDVPRQLAHDQDVQTGHDVGLQRAGLGQLRVDHGRAQVGEEVEMLAQPQEPLLRTLRTRQLVVGRAAHRTEQDGTGRFAHPQRLLGQRITRGIDGCAAHQRRFGLHVQPVTGQHLQNPNRLRGDLGTDAVTGQHCNLHFDSSCPSKHESQSPPEMRRQVWPLMVRLDGNTGAACPGIRMDDDACAVNAPGWPAARARPGNAAPRRPGCRRRAAASARSRPAR